MKLVVDAKGVGRDGKTPSRYTSGTSRLSIHDKALEIEQDFGWKRELFAPESSFERKGRLKREITRRNNGLWFAAGWAEIWKQDLRGTLPSFGRKLH